MHPALNLEKLLHPGILVRVASLLNRADYRSPDLIVQIPPHLIRELLPRAMAASKAPTSPRGI